MKKQTTISCLFCLALLFDSCTSTNKEGNAPEQRKETFSLNKLVPEEKTAPDSIIKALNAMHHQLKVLERRTVPGPFTAPAMKHYAEYAIDVNDLPVINPGPGEYVHVMEGQRAGYQNLTIGITETFPGGAPPMHSHEGEESHVLLEGEILYALGDTVFTMKAPYMVNIQAGVPHAFKNIGEKTANLVVIFPTNIWKYDVLDYFPFDSDTVNVSARFANFKNKLAKN
ncbi:MAG: cupin domain-containing protein [Imperialibacter sp.]|uniref:cupin domain-containing protein n=1 Tax=Imperialibacter sp. TaxID=2038411 RepID=UPI0032ED65D2